MADIQIDEVLRAKSAASLDPDENPEEIRGMTPEELKGFIDVLDAHLRSLHQTDEGEIREQTPDEVKAFDYGMKLRDKALARFEQHQAIQEVFRRRPKAVVSALKHSTYGDDDYGDIRRLTAGEARDRALRRLDDRESTLHLAAHQKDHVARMMRYDPMIARRILVTENEDYRNAWMKLVTDPHPILSEEERHAVQAWYEFRAMGEVTTSAGGFGIPVNQAA